MIGDFDIDLYALPTPPPPRPNRLTSPQAPASSAPAQPAVAPPQLHEQLAKQYPHWAPQQHAIVAANIQRSMDLGKLPDSQEVRKQIADHATHMIRLTTPAGGSAIQHEHLQAIAKHFGVKKATTDPRSTAIAIGGHVARNSLKAYGQGDENWTFDEQPWNTKLGQGPYMWTHKDPKIGAVSFEAGHRPVGGERWVRDRPASKEGRLDSWVDSKTGRRTLFPFGDDPNAHGGLLAARDELARKTPDRPALKHYRKPDDFGRFAGIRTENEDGHGPSHVVDAQPHAGGIRIAAHAKDFSHAVHSWLGHDEKGDLTLHNHMVTMTPHERANGRFLDILANQMKELHSLGGKKITMTARGKAALQLAKLGFNAQLNLHDANQVGATKRTIDEQLEHGDTPWIMPEGFDFREAAATPRWRKLIANSKHSFHMELPITGTTPPFFKRLLAKRQSHPSERMALNEEMRPARENYSMAAMPGSPGFHDSPTDHLDSMADIPSQVKESAQRRFQSLPGAIRKPVEMTFKTAYAPYILANKAVQAVARERGLPQAHIDRVSHGVAAADMMLGGTRAGSIGAALAGPVGAAAGFAPVGSLLYLAYSALRNPHATWRAAKKGVQAAIAKVRGKKT